MFSFEEKIIGATVEKLLNGEDYRQEVVNDINVKFLDFTLEFFKKIVPAHYILNIQNQKQNFLYIFVLQFLKEDKEVQNGTES